MRTTILIAITLIATLTAPVAAVAQESPPTTRASGADVDTLKREALAAIDRRFETLDALARTVAEAEHLTEDHAAALTREIEATRSGLEQLAREIEAATTIAELRELIPAIAEDYRVYVLVSPKVGIVIAADTITHAVDRFSQAEAQLTDAVERATDAGLDTGDAATALAEMEAAVDEAERLVTGVADSVLPLTPADWPEPAAAVLAEAVTDLSNAAQSLRTAAAAAEDVVEELEELTSA